MLKKNGICQRLQIILKQLLYENITEITALLLSIFETPMPKQPKEPQYFFEYLTTKIEVAPENI